MRISDCSSDVCSSDLRVMKVKREILGERPVPIDVVEKPAVARTEQYHMVGYFGEGAANPQMADEEARRPALARKGFASRLPRGCAHRSRSEGRRVGTEGVGTV